MQNLDEKSITNAVLATFGNCADKRLAVLMTALVQHLHDFARETQLTEAEWFSGVRFLTETGAITSDRRQEFILLSDTLGLSTLVMAQNNPRPTGCTEPTVFGPFFVDDAPRCDNGADIANGAKGVPCWVSGTVRGVRGEPIAGATLEVWQSDGDGFYDIQYSDVNEPQARATLLTRSDGSFDFRSVVASPYPIPTDGPVGTMLNKVGRHPWRPAHLHFMITAPGYARLITHVFRRDSPYLDTDTVFGVRSTLVSDWIRHEPGVTPDGNRCDVPYYTLHYDFVLPRSPAA